MSQSYSGAARCFDEQQNQLYVEGINHHQKMMQDELEAFITCHLNNRREFLRELGMNPNKKYDDVIKHELTILFVHIMRDAFGGDHVSINT